MFAELFTYDPATLDPEIREQMAGVLQARSELLAAQAEVAALRARAWGGEVALDGIIDLKAAELARLRQDNSNRMRALLKGSVDVEELLEVLPTVGVLLLQKFNIPLPVILEAAGVDLDAIKALLEATKELFNEL